MARFGLPIDESARALRAAHAAPVTGRDMISARDAIRWSVAAEVGLDRATTMMMRNARAKAMTSIASAGMTRRDAHWAPGETDRMMLLSTWTPLGAANEGRPGRR